MLQEPEWFLKKPTWDSTGLRERTIWVLRQKLPPSEIIPCTSFHFAHNSFLGIKLNPTFKACLSYFLLLWFWSSFCLYPVFVRWVSSPLRKLYQMVIEQGRWNMLNILNTQLLRETGKASCFSSLTQEQGEIKLLSYRLGAVLSRDGRTEEETSQWSSNRRKASAMTKKNPWCHDLYGRSKRNCIKLHEVEI